MSNEEMHPIPWLGEGSVPPGGGGRPGPVRARGRVGLVAGSLALVLGMGVGGVAVSQLSLGGPAGSGASQSQGVGTGGESAGPGTAAQPPAGGEERDED